MKGNYYLSRTHIKTIYYYENEENNLNIEVSVLFYYTIIKGDGIYAIPRFRKNRDKSK